MITAYTSPDSIRAILGVSEQELEDVTILDPVYSTVLDEALYDLGLDLPDHFAIVQETAPKTRTQARFVNVVATWSAYQVAQQLVLSVKMFAPKTIKSEKDQFDRILDPYSNLRGDIEAMLDNLKVKIGALYGELFPSEPAVPETPARTLVIASPLGTDPVTG
jgi:hypothetical protein